MADDQTTPEVTDLGAIQGSGDDTIPSAPGSIPVTEIRPQDTETLVEAAPADFTKEDVGTFSLRYRGVVPQLVITGGTIVPSVITAVDGNGNIVAEFEARPAKRITSRLLPEDPNQLGCATADCKPFYIVK
ncbi:hypothetical protein ACFYNN_30565 [Streptomyces sp. NPDC006978]|uniref:hypothetical protein n=1 Tax=unclassified Streptomyces TaxID=2593676 RepID=UPI002AFF81F7|nr:hypothetical protein [Streptomyces sp. S584]